MARTKRTFEDTADLDGAHPDRRKRVKYTEADAQLASVYNDLADEVAGVRIKAAGELLKVLSTKSDDQYQRLDAAETRLIKGLCSGRKAARLGFSIALAETYRLRFGLQTKSGGAIGLPEAVEKILKLTQVQNNVSGQERRDYLLGRRFAFQAILHSDIALNDSLSDVDWQKFVQSIFELASQKQWLRRECGVVLHDYLVSPTGGELPDGRVREIFDVALEHKVLSTPEGVGLWITCMDRFPSVKMPKDVWHHRDPLSSKERTALSKVMLDNSVQDEDEKKKAGARQITPSFAWKVLLAKLYSQETDRAFKHFWDETVVQGMFSTTSSAERRALGLQIFTLAVATAPVTYLPGVLHNNILQCIYDQRADSKRYLFDAAKAPLNQIVTRAKAEPAVVAAFCCELIDRQLLNFDQATKTKTVETLLQAAEDESLRAITQRINDTFGSVGRAKATDPMERTALDQRMKALADFTLTLIRQRKDSGIVALNAKSTSWLATALRCMTSIAYIPQERFDDRSLVRARLMSCLNAILSCPSSQVLEAPIIVVRNSTYPTLTNGEDGLIHKADDCMEEAYNLRKDDSGARAFALLFALSMIQLFNREPDAIPALQDLITCYEARHDKGDSLTMLVELLLSFVSKQSALFRKLAEQAFSAFAADLTTDALQSLLDILEQKESLSGQQELFDENGGDQADGGSGSEDEEGVDVEDASDVELVNGKEASASESEEDSDGDSSEAEEGAEDGEDEEAIFDKKLAEALGTNGMDDADSDDDGSDMDDDQMMDLEPHLATIFKERQKTTSKKQDKKDAKENMVNFKNRVLDLLTIYVKSQYANVMSLDLILPLTTLVRTTTNKATSEKAFAVLKQYFETCNKHKTFPQPEGHEAVLAVLEAVHEEMKLGGSKLHANACSRSSLFLSKVLVGLDRQYYERIAAMYAKLQSEWWLDGTSKVQGSVFTEWTSWSIGTRK